MNKTWFRRENLLLSTAIVTFLGIVGVCCYGITVPDSSIALDDNQIVISALLAASTSWAGIQSYHRVRREAQRARADEFLMSLPERTGDGGARDEYDGGAQ